jgi:Doubled CXXCH motif (Paired_CXXCH_1)/Cytochrome c554 and c-prime
MRPRTRFALAAAGVAAAIGVAWLVARYRSERMTAMAAARAVTFVGSAQCARCHVTEYAAWTKSHHAAAMQRAEPATVLGRFDSTSVPAPDATASFFRRGAQYVVHTHGADGRLHDFAVRYTFGVWPLQQYLVAFPGGRLQALTVAWDARPASSGGQRWYSLDSAARAPGTDDLRWTGPEFNWNFMCADCHSTGVRKGYDAVTDSYHTTVAELSVGCEACHGPGSAHLTWAATPAWTRRLFWSDDGLPAQLTERRGVQWRMDPGASIAHRSPVRTTDREIETCAQCHARRIHIADGYAAGAPLLDFYIPDLIDSDLYYPDGEQLDEVYVYVSFLQSKMYRAGVTCSDCHEPHSGRLRRPGNQLCGQCHRASTYDTPAHSFHASGSAGAQCVACHMPTTTYMGIQARPDHSMSVPRPDLSVTMGVPNACNRCHANRDARWAAAQIRAWYGTRAGANDRQRFAVAFDGDDRGASWAADSLGAVAEDPTESAIVRASALARLSRHPGPTAFGAAGRNVRDADAMVRLAALQILEAAPARMQLALVVPLLGDRTRAVRQGAAWVLAPLFATVDTSAARAAFRAAAAEFIASQRYNADQPSNCLTLGAFFTQLGRFDVATREFRAALRLAPGYAREYPAIAAGWRARGWNAAAESMLRALRPTDR